MAPKVRPEADAHQPPKELRPSPKADQKKRSVDKKSATLQRGECETVDLNMAMLIIRKNPKENARIFWNALKVLCAQKCGGPEGAFKKFSDSKDGLMSFQNFQELLEHMGMRFNPRTARVFFRQALREGEATLAVHDFTGMLVPARIEKIRGALQEYNESLLRTSGHIDRFMAHLVMKTSDINRRRAISRFQNKLTLELLMELRTSMQNWTVRRRWDSPEVLTDMDSTSFLKIVETVRTIQGYEADFLRNIFSYVDRGHTDRAKINDLLVILMLVSGGNSRREKAGFLFVLFDLDGKGCLTQDQLLLMYCSCTILSVIARGDQLSSNADMLFGDELSLAKARRLYDYTVERLAHHAVDEYCSFAEWWSAIGSNEMLLRELVPGTQSCDWVIKPAPRKRGEKEPRSISKMGALVQGRMREIKLMSKGTSAFARRTEEQQGSNAKRCNPSGVGSKAGPLQAPGMMNADLYRVEAAICFRHAVRGEWDQVDALQQGPVEAPAPQEKLAISIADRLPTLALSNNSAAGNASHSPSKEASDPQNKWNTEVTNFGWRARQPNWVERHQETLTNWVRHPSKAEHKLGGLGAQSLPSLPRKAIERNLDHSESNPTLRRRPNPLDASPTRRSGRNSRSEDASPFFSASSPKKVQESTGKKVAELKMETKMAESDALEAQIFGKGALDRIRGFSEAKYEALKDSWGGENLRRAHV